jgi:hypothetical protein
MFTTEPTHFYDLKDNERSMDGSLFWSVPGNSSFARFIEVYYTMWLQYKELIKYCSRKNISIINCTEGGLLDIFPRKKLIELIEDL